MVIEKNDKCEIAGLVHSHGRGLLRRLANTVLAVSALVLFGIAPQNSALAETPKIALELNRIEAIEGRCRITFLSTNGFDNRLERLVVELVLFDADRHAVRFMRVALSALGAGRSRAQVFDAKGLECEKITDILLNNVVECRVLGAEDSACKEAVVPSSRANAGFVTGFSNVPE